MTSEPTCATYLQGAHGCEHARTRHARNARLPAKHGAARRARAYQIRTCRLRIRYAGVVAKVLTTAANLAARVVRLPNDVEVEQRDLRLCVQTRRPHAHARTHTQTPIAHKQSSKRSLRATPQITHAVVAEADYDVFGGSECAKCCERDLQQHSQRCLSSKVGQNLSQQMNKHRS